MRKYKQSFRAQFDYLGDKIAKRRQELENLERDDLMTDVPYLDELIFEARKQDAIHGIGKHLIPGLFQILLFQFVLLFSPPSINLFISLN